jgi:hypothetical protein
MYIPTIFLGAQGGCIDCIISGSSLPPNVTVGNVTSGSDRYFFIKLEGPSSIEFDIEGSVTNNAKLLLVGGGGYKDSTIIGLLGGGAAGSVIFQDISLQPNRYFLSSSYGGSSGQNTGGSARFIVPYDEPDPLKRTEIIANGGGPNEGGNLGGDNDFFTGGTAISAAGTPGGGGGAGSTSNGGNARVTTGTPNSSTGGNGGSGSVIPAPFSDVVGYSIVGIGGVGEGSIDGTLPHGSPNAWGNGGSSTLQLSDNGNNGIAVLFIPITGCTTSSVEDEDFYAEGGTEGTFFSGSVQYKYHVFTGGNQQRLFHVKQGYTQEAKTLIVAGGAGSSTFTYKDNSDRCIQTGGGAGAGGLAITENVVLFGPNIVAGVGGGGLKFANGSNSTLKTSYINSTNLTLTGGGRGAYDSRGSHSPSTGLANNGGSGGGGLFGIDLSGGLGTAGQGNNGGDGKSGGLFQQMQAGGGGGGRGSAGSNADFAGPPVVYTGGAGGSGFNLSSTIFSFLTGSVYTSRPDIAIGGSGSSGFYDSTAGTCTAAPLRPNGSQANDGSGANPVNNASGNDGIVVITYPISGSISNS